MKSTTSNAIRRSLAVVAAVAAAVVAAACAADAPVAPSTRPARVALTELDTGSALRAVELGACEELAPTEPSVVAFRVYASGDQIYRWNGAAWDFVAPDAELYADAAGNGIVGTHYVGPTWESNSGGKVVGSSPVRCTADENAIPWLLLKATPDDGAGIFQRTTFIQRLNTVGGKAPAEPGASVGEVRRVAYTADYVFYRPE